MGGGERAVAAGGWLAGICGVGGGGDAHQSRRFRALVAIAGHMPGVSAGSLACFLLFFLLLQSACRKSLD
jgi:hypothetical protein